MSKIIHRQPVWGWSVALLSTLLLSPVAANAVLHALAQAMPMQVVEAPRTQAPRRSDDEETLRLAARDGATYAQRLLDLHPDAVAVFFTRQSVCLGPDEVDSRAFFAAPASRSPVSSALFEAPPRAPPT